MFEDKELADRAVIAVEKVVHHEDMEPVVTNKVETQTVEKVA